MYDDPSKGAAKLGGWMKSVCPDEYKGHLDKVGQGLEMAAELKRKKDEMQINMIEKALAKILEQANITGDINKSDCVQLTKDLLDKIGQADKFHQKAFDTIYGQVDKENVGKITQRQMAELVNLMAFGGM